MRKITKHAPPPDGVRCGSWPQATATLRVELERLAEGSERTERARTHFGDQLSGAHRQRSVQALSDEQHALCAFCERRVNPTEPSNKQRAFVRVAHWTPIKHDPFKAVTWGNLFASCSAPDTCDVRQESVAPGFETPAERDWTLELEFDATGGMSARASARAEFAAAVPGLWNLNADQLKRARQEAVNAEREVVLKKAGRGPKAPVLNARIARHEAHPQQFQSAVLFMLRRWRTRGA